MKLKLVHKDGATLVENAETGERLDGLVGVEFSHKQGTPGNLIVEIKTFDVQLEADEPMIIEVAKGA